MKWQCGPFCIARSVIGGNSSKVSMPSRVGITGADYSDALCTRVDSVKTLTPRSGFANGIGEAGGHATAGSKSKTAKNLTSFTDMV